MPKDCLSREINTIFLTLRSCYTQSFDQKWFNQSEMIRIHKKVLSFGKVNARWIFCIHLCWSNVLSICSKSSIKTKPWAIFARVSTAKYIPGCNGESLEDDYCVPFFKLKFLIHITSMFYTPKTLDIYGEYDIVSSVSGNKLGKYTFLWF